MTRRASALNRFWIGLLGLLMLLAGVAGLAIGTDQARRLVADRVPVPAPQDQVVAVPAELVTRPIVLVIIGVSGLLLAVLVIAWLVAQLPRSERAEPYRISDDPAAGLTTVSARVLSDAVTDDVLSLPGVESADVVVRGAVDAPELVMSVSARTDADLTGLLAELRSGVPERFGRAVDTPVRHVGVRLDLLRERVTEDRLTVA